MFKITRNDIKNTYWKIFQCGYCEIQSLANILGFRKLAYNSGIYGWNYHLYEVNDDCCILTGYRGMFGISLDGEELRVFERRASKLTPNDKEEIQKLENDFYSFLIRKFEK